ncbi:MAG: sigma-70 family RNA polymerase sigma factor [Pirellulales bacterium]
MSKPPQPERVDEFLQLLANCERRLYGYILSLVQSFHDADDIAQETRTRLWQQFAQFEPGTDFEAWARTIAHFQVLTFREKTSRQRLQFKQSVVDQLAEEFAERSELYIDRQQALLYCIESVDEPSRDLLRLVYAEGLKIKEAAARQGRTTSGAYKALERLRQRLQTCIENRLAEDET